MKDIRYDKNGRELTPKQLALRIRQLERKRPKVELGPEPSPFVDDLKWVVYTGPDNPPWLDSIVAND